MNRRVVVTGGGIVSSIGTSVDEFWRNCLEGKSNVRPIPSHWEQYANYHSRLWSPLPEFDPESMGVARTERLQLDPVTVIALGAARQALLNAGYEIEPAEAGSRTFTLRGVDNLRAGVFLGTGLGGAVTFLQNHTHHLMRAPRIALMSYAEKQRLADGDNVLQDIIARMTHGLRFNPFEVSMVMPNAPAAAVGIKYTLHGENETCSMACASGTMAIGHAYRAVRDGRADVALSGGCEYFGDEHGHIFRSFDVSGTLVRDCDDPDTANCPFDVRRSGFLFSQGGAAVLVVEELEHARNRGASIIAELIGFSETFDAYSMMSLAPSGEQIERVVRTALADARVSSDEVDYVNAHGTGTKNNDQIEAEVISRLFGKTVRINSTKSLLGHTIGASGATEALVTALTLRDGITHVCRNLESPEFDLNFIRSAGHFDPRIGLSESFAFGGHNAALVMSRFNC